MNSQKAILLVISLCFISCSFEQDIELPEHISRLENLTVYSADAKPAETLSFEKDAVYGETGDVLIGRMGEVVVDHQGRVFIADVGNMVIHAFEPDGRIISQFGRRGSGPGEFSSYIRNLQIRNNRLYAFDPNPRRLTVFSLDSLDIETTVLLSGNRSSYEELSGAYPWIRTVYVREDDTYLAEFTMHAIQERTQRYQNIDVMGLYYLLGSNGDISQKMFEFTSEIRTNLLLVTNLEDFFGHVLRGFSSDDHIYLAEPDYFLVKTYSPDGDYQRAFFYPLRKIPLTRELAIEAGISDKWSVSGREISLMESVDLPNNWPVLTDMVIDDQDRFWVATTVEDMKVYEWWVLEENGEFITKFEWPRDEPIEVVKNGYMYTRETDEETGLQQIVRYRIEMD